MTTDEKLAFIDQLDLKFEAASAWGSWMVMAANERERLVNELRVAGINIEHKWLARTASGGRTD